MGKVKLKMWKSARKVVKHKLADKVVELKDDRSLFVGKPSIGALLRWYLRLMTLGPLRS